MIRFLLVLLVSCGAAFGASPVSSGYTGIYDWQIVGASSTVAAVSKSSCQPHASSYVVAPTDGIGRLALFYFAPPRPASVSALRISVCAAAVSTAGEYGGSRYIMVTDPVVGYGFNFTQVDSGGTLFRETVTTLPLDPRTGAPWTPAGADSLLTGGLYLFGMLVPVGLETGMAVSRFDVSVIP